MGMFILILARTIREGDLIRTFKAPTGKLYEIHGFYGTVTLPGDNGTVVLNRAFEEPPDETINIDTEQDSTIFVMTSDTAHSVSFQLTNPVRTKYISFARITATAFQQTIIIDYDLVIGSKADLIWEWFSKRR